MGVHGEPFPRRQPMCQCASKPWSPLPTVRVVLYMLQTKTRRCCASAPMTLRCCVTVTAPTIGAGIFNGWVFLWRWGCNLVNIGLLSECCSANLDCWRQVKSSSRVLRRKAADPIKQRPKQARERPPVVNFVQERYVYFDFFRERFKCTLRTSTGRVRCLYLLLSYCCSSLARTVLLCCYID